MDRSIQSPMVRSHAASAVPCSPPSVRSGPERTAVGPPLFSSHPATAAASTEPRCDWRAAGHDCHLRGLRTHRLEPKIPSVSHVQRSLAAQLSVDDDGLFLLGAGR